MGIAGWFVIVGAGTSCACGQVAFRGVGDLPGGGVLSECFAVSSDGATAAGGSIVAGSGFSQIYDAFLHDVESASLTPSYLGPAGSARAYALTAGGELIVGVCDYGFFSDLGTQAFIWRRGELPELIGDLPGGAAGVPRSYARGVSSDGRWVVGIGESAAGTEGWRFETSTGQFQGLGDLPGGQFASYAYAISADGSTIVGQSYADANQQAVFWRGTDGPVAMGFLPLDPGQIPASSAEAASQDGAVIVGWSRHSAAGLNGQEAFRWTQAGGMEALGDLEGGAVFSAAYACSADGDVVVGRASIAGTCGPFGCGSEGRAFLWTRQGGMINLQDYLAQRGADVSGWRLQEARGVSADGRVVVGNGINPAGQPEGWVAVLAPTPGPCDPDFNRDGVTDQDDVAYLVHVIAGGDNPTGRDPDFNRDGVADQEDYAALVNVVAGGACP